MTDRKNLGIVGGPWPGVAKEKCGTCAWFQLGDDTGRNGECCYEPQAHSRSKVGKACHHWAPTAEDAADYPDDMVPVVEPAKDGDEAES